LRPIGRIDVSGDGVAKSGSTLKQKTTANGESFQFFPRVRESVDIDLKILNKTEIMITAAVIVILKTINKALEL
jgi:hypothetical protein